MKNITVSLDDRLYRLARIRAAERQSTVTAMVREFLAGLVAEEPLADQLRRDQNDIIAAIRSNSPGFSASARLPREQVHERDAVR